MAYKTGPAEARSLLLYVVEVALFLVPLKKKSSNRNIKLKTEKVLLDFQIVILLIEISIQVKIIFLVFRYYSVNNKIFKSLKNEEKFTKITI